MDVVNLKIFHVMKKIFLNRNVMLSFYLISMCLCFFVSEYLVFLEAL